MPEKNKKILSLFTAGFILLCTALVIYGYERGILFVPSTKPAKIRVDHTVTVSTFNPVPASDVIGVTTNN